MLGPRDTAPADARATLRLTLRTWGLAHVSNEAETVISEQVTSESVLLVASLTCGDSQDGSCRVADAGVCPQSL
jgi:hypothetical protein